jgi:hypothetical protein
MCIWQLEPLHTGNNISIDPSPSKIEEEVLDMAKIEDIQVFQSIDLPISTKLRGPAPFGKFACCTILNP